MADKNIQMTQRNAANTAWDNIFPLTKAANVIAADGTTTFEKHLADNEYQTPTIVGTQIRITRQSGTKRLSFYLSADLSGGNITISLDGGTTSQPLKDIDGVQLTQLSKGYVEVVYNTTFFTYAPKGALKITGQNEITAVFQETINKYDAVYIKNAFDFDTCTALTAPTTLPTGSAEDVVFSADGIYLAIAHATTPFISIYKRSGDTFTKLSNPSTRPTGNANGVAFSADGIYLAVAHTSSPYVSIYKRSGDTFTKLSNPDIIPASYGHNVAFSTDGIYMAVTHASSPYVTIYKRSGDTFTKLSNPNIIPPNNCYGVAFSTDGIYLAVGHDTNPCMTIYKRSGDTFTKLSNPDIIPTNPPMGIAFSTDGMYMAVAHFTSPYVTIYKRSGDTFTKLSNPTTLPMDYANGVGFSADGMYMTVVSDTNPYMVTYKATTSIYKAFKSDNLLSNVLTADGLGYAKASGILNDYIKVMSLWM